MQPESLYIDVLTKFGSAGLLAFVMWVVAKRFMDETVKQMSARIDALEARSNSCEEDRKKLHEKVFLLLSDPDRHYRNATPTHD